MLIFILKKEWYEKYRLGVKNREYRGYKEYWHRRLGNAFYEFMYGKPGKEFAEYGVFPLYFNPDRSAAMKIIPRNYETGKYMPCILQKGYSPRERMRAEIGYITVADGSGTDLKTVSPVYEIGLMNIRAESGEKKDMIEPSPVKNA